MYFLAILSYFLRLLQFWLLGGKKTISDGNLYWSFIKNYGSELCSEGNYLYTSPIFCKFTGNFPFIQIGLQCFYTNPEEQHQYKATVKNGHVVTLDGPKIFSQQPNIDDNIYVLPDICNAILVEFNTKESQKGVRTNISYDVTSCIQDLYQRPECLTYKLYQILPLLLQFYNIRYSPLQDLKLFIVLDNTFDVKEISYMDQFIFMKD